MTQRKSSQRNRRGSNTARKSTRRENKKPKPHQKTTKTNSRRIRVAATALGLGVLGLELLSARTAKTKKLDAILAEANHLVKKTRKLQQKTAMFIKELNYYQPIFDHIVADLQKLSGKGFHFIREANEAIAYRSVLKYDEVGFQMYVKEFEDAITEYRQLIQKPTIWQRINPFR